MCARFTFLSYDEVADVIRELRMTSVPNPMPDWPAVHASAYPQAWVTVIRPTEQSLGFQPEDEVEDTTTRTDPSNERHLAHHDNLFLEPTTLRWGFETSWSKDVIFNTRIESSEKPFWRQSLRERRCLVPCLGFYEPHQSETTKSPRSGKTIKRSYYFTAPDDSVLLMAGVWKEDRFSLLTTEPNAVVAPIHRRMPLIISPSEVEGWFGENYLNFADRSKIQLKAEPEYQETQPLF